jgi:hypothetical protein
MERVIRSHAQLLKWVIHENTNNEGKKEELYFKTQSRNAFAWAARDLSVIVGTAWVTAITLTCMNTRGVLRFGYLACCHCFSHQNSKRHVGCKVVHGIRCTELPYENSGGRTLEVGGHSYSPAFKEKYFGTYCDWRLAHSGQSNGMISGITPPLCELICSQRNRLWVQLYRRLIDSGLFSCVSM